MRALEEKILAEGQILPGGIVKVGSFLNQQVDMGFMRLIGDEIARLFAGDNVTKIMTIESSGIVIAVAAGMAMGVPMLFAKKGKSANVDGSVYAADVRSFTHGNMYPAIVSREYLCAGERVLLVDDFLASGSAFRGLISLCQQAGAEVAGLCAAVEKGFQQGGDCLRKEGFRVESLAIIDSMEDGKILFRS